MEVIEAHVLDSTHLELAHPVQAMAGEKVWVAIGSSQGVAEEHHDWVQMSMQKLSSAYGPDEPEYSLDRIKIPNTEFQS
jgi:hypothetical protein